MDRQTDIYDSRGAFGNENFEYNMILLTISKIIFYFSQHEMIN